MNTASFEEIETLPGFIREKIASSDEVKGHVKLAENMAGGPRVNRPAGVHSGPPDAITPTCENPRNGHIQVKLFVTRHTRSPAWHSRMTLPRKGRII